jgi:hypothetical protein
LADNFGAKQVIEGSENVIFAPFFVNIAKIWILEWKSNS